MSIKLKSLHSIKGPADLTITKHRVHFYGSELDSDGVIIDNMPFIPITDSYVKFDESGTLYSVRSVVFDLSKDNLVVHVELASL